MLDSNRSSGHKSLSTILSALQEENRSLHAEIEELKRKLEAAEVRADNLQNNNRQLNAQLHQLQLQLQQSGEGLTTQVQTEQFVE
jgi:peptidoglycan hydrolase CwlO-like protein